MLVTLFFSGWLYVDWLIGCLYLLLGVTTLSTFLFSIRFFLKSAQSDPKRSIRAVGYTFIIICLLGSCYLLGSGDVLNIPNYRGMGNSYEWLKITDMWIYSIYVLLSLVIVSILVGIIWSYIKKRG